MEQTEDWIRSIEADKVRIRLQCGEDYSNEKMSGFFILCSLISKDY